MNLMKATNWSRDSIDTIYTNHWELLTERLESTSVCYMRHLYKCLMFHTMFRSWNASQNMNQFEVSPVTTSPSQQRSGPRVY